MDDAIVGIGTDFLRWNSALSVWETVGQINTITGPSMSRPTIDVTHLQTTTGYRAFKAGLRDGGTVVLNMNYTRAAYETFKADFESDDLQNYQIVLPDEESTSLEFEGLVTDLPLTIPEEKVTMDVTIKVSESVETESGSAATP